MTKQRVQGDVITLNHKNDLVIEAEKLDREVRSAWASAKPKLMRVAKLLKKIQESELWKYLKVRRYSGFHDYMKSVIGADWSESHMYELLTASGLTVGENPLSEKAVEKMGIKKSCQLARLRSNQRDPETVKKVMRASVQKARQIVQEKINETLPEAERREITVLFSRNYTPTLVSYFEEVESIAIYMEGIRDGDTSVTLREKFMHAMLVNFCENYAHELAEAQKVRAAKESRSGKSSAAASEEEDEEGEDVPPDLDTHRSAVRAGSSSLD